VFNISPPPPTPNKHIISLDMWKNIVEPDRLQTTIWRKGIACWISNLTYTHSEYVIIMDFLRQKCLREYASISIFTTRISRFVWNNQPHALLIFVYKYIAFAEADPCLFLVYRARNITTESFLIPGISYWIISGYSKLDGGDLIRLYEKLWGYCVSLRKVTSWPPEFKTWGFIPLNTVTAFVTSMYNLRLPVSIFAFTKNKHVRVYGFSVVVCI
jgi:hypothetical protein